MLKRVVSVISNESFGASLLRVLAGSAGLRIVGMGFGLLVGVQLARSLGSSGYGLYGLAMSIISIVAIPIEFGLPQLLTREISVAHVRNEWGAAHAILRWAFQLVLLLAVGALLIGSAFIWSQAEVFDVSLINALGAGCLFVLLAPIGNICGAALRGMQKIVAGQLFEVLLRPALQSMFLFFWIFVFSDGLTANVALILQAASVGVCSFLAYWYLRHIMPNESYQSVTYEQKNRWLRSSWPLALTEIMRIVQGNIAILVLGSMAAISAVGAFRVGSSVSALIAMPVALIQIVLSPMFARFHSSGEFLKLQRLAGWASFAMVVGIFCILTPFLFEGGWILGELFGRDFEGANSTLLILSFGYVAGSIFGPGATLLNMTGNEKVVTRSLVFSLILQCGLMFPLVHWFEADGAAFASAISYTVWSILMWHGSFKVLDMDTSVAVIFKRGFKVV